MSRAPIAAVLFAAAAALVAGARPAATQPYAAPAAVQVPYNAAVYGQPGGFSQADAKRVVELLESIDKRLGAIEEKTGPAPALAAKGPDLLAVAKMRCAGCHTPARAEAKGGGFILLADDKAQALKPLSARERARVKEAVEGGTMPPNGKLSPAERSAFSP